MARIPSVRRLLSAVLAAFVMAGSAAAAVDDVRTNLTANPTDTVWCSNPNLSSTAGENVTKIFDAATNNGSVTGQNSKWLVSFINNGVLQSPNNGTYPRAWVTYQFNGGKGYKIGSYDFYTGNDSQTNPQRNPVAWRLLGSNDGVTWATLDARSNQIIPSVNPNSLAGPYTISGTPGPDCYNMYRFEVLKVQEWQDDQFQIGELRLHDACGTAGPLPVAPTINSLTLQPSPNLRQFSASVSATSNDGGTLSYEWHVLDRRGVEVPQDGTHYSGTGPTPWTNQSPVVMVETAGTYYAWVMVRSSTGAGIRYPALNSLTRLKPVTSNNAETTGFEMANAVDGNPVSRWSSTDATGVYYLQVDLGAEVHVDRVTLQWHDSAYANRFQVLGAKSGNDWTLMYDKSPNYEVGQDLNRTNGLTPATIRYLRVRCVQSVSTYFSLSELNATSPGRPVTVINTVANQNQPAFVSQAGLQFSSGTAGVVMPDVAADIFTGGLTISAWIKPSDVATGRRLFYLGNSTDKDGALGADDISVQFNGTGLSLIVANHTGAAIATANSAKALNGAWNHVAAVVDPVASMVYIYVNGATIASASASLSDVLPAFTRNCRLGVNGVGGQSFIGQMRDIRVWNRPLIPAEIRSTMVVPLTGTEPGLLAWYPCRVRPATDMSVANLANRSVIGAGVRQDYLVSDNFSDPQRRISTELTATPFGSVEVVDPDTMVPTGYIYTGTITLSDPTVGRLSGTGVTARVGTAGLYDVTGNGSVGFQSNLRAMVFTPDPSWGTTLQIGQRVATTMTLSFHDDNASGTSVGDARIEVYKAGAGTGLNAQWWNNTTFTGAPVATNLVTNFSTNAVATLPTGVNNTNFSARFTGTFIPNFSGWYKFQVQSDDNLWIYLNGTLVMTAGVTGNTTYRPSDGAFYFTSGVANDLRIDFNQGTGGFYLAVRLLRVSDNGTVDFGAGLYPYPMTLTKDQPAFCNLQSVNFDGSPNDATQVNNLPSVRLPTLHMSAPMTFEAWVRNENFNQVGYFFWMRGDNDRDLFLRTRAGGILDVGANQAGLISSPTALNLNTWEHLAVVYRPASPRCSLYRNGVSIAYGDLNLDATVATPSAAGVQAVLGRGFYTGSGLRSDNFDGNPNLTGAPNSTNVVGGFNAYDCGGDNRSRRMVGTFVPSTAMAGSYKFMVNADDGATLWVNGVKAIDAWTQPIANYYSAAYTLVPGVPMDIRLEYRNFTGGRALYFRLQKQSDSTFVDFGTTLYPPDYWAASALRGSMADVRIWNVERTAAEIQRCMTRQPTADEPGLLAWFLRSNDQGATLADQTGRMAGATLQYGANITIPVVGNNLAAEPVKNTVAPFNDIVLLDPDTDPAITDTYNYVITIDMDDTRQGILSGSTVVQAKGANGTGPYELQVIGLGAAQTLLRSLVFTPADDLVFTPATVPYVNFRLRFNDGHAPVSGSYLRTVQVSNLNTGSPVATGDQPPFISLPAVYMGSGNRNSDIPYGDFVQLPVIPLGPSATVELWVKSDGQLTSNCRLVELDTARNSNNDSFRLYSWEGRGLLRFQTYNWTNNCTSNGWAEITNAPFPVNQWTHVAMVADNGQRAMAYLYVNGQVSASYSMLPTMSTAARTIAYLGRANDGGKYFQGWMKDVRIWKTARTQAQIQGYMTRPVDAAEPGLIGYYQTAQLDCTGQVLVDSAAVPVGNAQLVNNAHFTGVSTIWDTTVENVAIGAAPTIAQPFIELELVDPDTADTTTLAYTATVTQQDAAGLPDDAQTLGVLSAGVGDGPAVTLASGTATINVIGLANLQGVLQRLSFTAAGQAPNTVAVANFALSIRQFGMSATSVGKATLRIVGRPVATVGDQPPFISLSAVRCATTSIATTAGVDLALTLAANTFAGNNATLECWVKAADPWTNWGRLIQVGTSPNATTDSLILSQVDGRGFLSGEVWNGGNKICAALTPPTLTLPMGQWVHVAEVLTRTPPSPNITLYRNGQKVSTIATLTNNLPQPASGFNACRLGLDPANGSQFRGLLSNVRIWNTARTQDQIQDNMTREPVVTTGLQAWYKIYDNTLTSNAQGTQTGMLLGGATQTGVLPSIQLWEICQPFQGVELVDPDSGPAATATKSYTLTVSTTAGTVRYANGVWLGAITRTVVGIGNAQDALRNVDFRRTDTAGTAVITVTVADRTNGTLANGGASQGVVSIPVVGTVQAVDQPTFCSLSAVKMDGTKGILRYVALPAFTAGPPFTVEAWAKISRTSGLVTTSLWDMGQNGQNAILRLVGSQPFTATWNSKLTPGTEFTSSVPATFDAWQHLAVVYQGPQELFYINGTLAYSRACAPVLGNVSRTLACFGCDNDNATTPVTKSYFTFMREMKDLRVWKGERTQLQIHDCMTGPIAANDANLLAWYRCQETDGTTLKNANITSGIGDATLIGSPEFTGASLGVLTIGGTPKRVATPFATAELVDPDTGRAASEATLYNITVNIDLTSDGGGDLSGNGIITGATGISDAQAQLRAMTFTPTREGMVRFFITINDHLSPFTYTSTASCFVSQDQPLFCNLPTVKFTSDLASSDATGDHVQLPILDLSGSITLETWVKGEATTDNWNRIFDFASGQESGQNDILVAGSNGTSTLPHIGFRNPVSNTIELGGVDSLTNLRQNTWTHVAAVFSAGTTGQVPSNSLYLNGYLQALGFPVTPVTLVPTAILPPNATRAQCRVGRSNWNNDRYFRGQMKGIRIWNVARTQAQIRASMTAPVLPKAEGLVADYPSVYYDQTKSKQAGDDTLGTSLKNVCTNLAPPLNNAIYGDATLQNKTRMNVGTTISAPAKIFAAAELFDPDTSDALTATYDYRVNVDISSPQIAGSAAGTLSGTGVTGTAPAYVIRAHGLSALLDRMRNAVFAPLPQAATAHVTFDLAISDGIAPSVTRGRVDILIAAGNALPPVPIQPPKLTKSDGTVPAVGTVGWTVVCDPGTWKDLFNPGQPAVTQFSYQWYRISNTAGVATSDAIPAAEGGQSASRVINDNDMGPQGGPPYISLVCQVTATSSVAPGLTATAWSDALSINKYPPVSVTNGALLATPATTTTVTLRFTCDEIVETPGGTVDLTANPCACEWALLDPATPFGKGPSLARIWTDILFDATLGKYVATNLVTVDRIYASYQFRVRVYTHKGAGLTATGQYSPWIDSNVLPVTAVPSHFDLIPDSPSIPNEGGRVDLHVRLLDQFNLTYVLSSTQTIVWSWTPTASSSLTPVSLSDPDFSRKLVTFSNVLPAQITVTATLYDGGVATDKTDQKTLDVVPGNIWKINFQPETSPTITTWYPDTGKPKGYRGVYLKDGTPLNYGWTFGGIETDLSYATRDRNDLRNSAPSVPVAPGDDPATIKQLYDTCIHTQRLAASNLDPVVYGAATTIPSDFNPPARWEICLPKGTYTVQLICGDGAYTNSTYAFSVWNNYGMPGQVLVPCTPASYIPVADGYLGPWNNNLKSGVITVSDTAPLLNGTPAQGYGNLIIVNGTGAVNNKLCGVIIQQMSVAN